MNLFRNVLTWIVLALVGALIAQLLLRDPGYVLVRFRGFDYETTLAIAIGITIATLALLWLLWRLLSLPFKTLRRRRERRQRAWLTDGFASLERGEWSQAEKSLLLAAEHDDAPALARLGAARAAASRGDMDSARQHLDALGPEHAGTRAIAQAEFAMAHGRPDEALAVLDEPAIQPLPPRGLALRAEALEASGRAGEAYGLLGALRQQQVWPDARLGRMEARWAEAGLREARDENELADRWEALPKPLRHDPAAVSAYAERAAALHWDDAAAKSMEDALDHQWDESLAMRYGQLPIGRLESRRTHAERWVQTHPGSPAALLTLARLSRAQGEWPQAESHLHRALAQGAGAPAWEELGDGYAATGDEARARLSYANALRAQRGEPIATLPDRGLRQQIHDHAVEEERDEHGMPRLRE